MENVIDIWLTNIDATVSTERMFRRVVLDFCRFIDKTPEQVIAEYIGDLKQSKMMPERAIYRDVPRYLKYLRTEKPNHLKRNGDVKKGLAPKSVGLYKSALRSFFVNHYIEFPILKRGDHSEPLEANANSFLNRTQMKELVTNTQNLRDRAIVLVVATSGMASNEFRNLKIKQCEIDDNDIMTIRLRREKARFDYVTFASPEAVHALRDYWSERERALGRELGPNDYVFVGERMQYIKGNIPLGERGVSQMFNRLGTALGYAVEDSGEMIATRAHAVRKYFSNTLRRAGMPKDYIDLLLGHKPKAVDRAYFQNLTDTLKDEYLKFLPHLTFHEDIIIKSLDSADALRLADVEKELAEVKENAKRIEEKSKQVPEALNIILSNPEMQAILAKKMKEVMGTVE
jgi:integrase